MESSCAFLIQKSLISRKGRRAICNFKFYDDPSEYNIVGSVTAVVDGKAYSNVLRFQSENEYTGTKYPSNLLIPKGADLLFKGLETDYGVSVRYRSNERDSDIKAITEQEHTAIIEKSVPVGMMAELIDKMSKNSKSGTNADTKSGEFNLERVDNKYYINGTDIGSYEISFYIEDGKIMFGINDYETNVIRHAEATIVDSRTLKFSGYEDWDITFVWDDENSFRVLGTGKSIATMINTDFFDTSMGG